MIVRDGAETLADCLASVVPVVDELVVVDTGSTDGTPEIARRFGAIVHRIEWPADFAAARNAYLDLARMPWILSLDCDEWLGQVEPTTFRRWLTTRPAAAYGVTIRNYVHAGRWPRHLAPSELAAGDGGRPWIPSRTVRLFPRIAGVKYAYPVHESLIPSVRARGLRLRSCALPIHHRITPPSREAAAAKLALYEELGLRKVAQYPRYFRGHLELGRIFVERSQPDRAEHALRTCIRLNPFSESAYYYLVLTLLDADRPNDARRALDRGLLRRLDRMYLEGLLHLKTGESGQGASLLRHVLRERPAYVAAQRALEAAGAER